MIIKSRRYRHLIVLIIFSMPFISIHAKASDIGIKWEAVNRFRLVKGADEELRYRKDMARITNASTHSKFQYPDPISDGKPPYQTYWKEGDDVYDPKYLSPGGNRSIEFTPQFPTNVRQNEATCSWRIDNLAAVNDPKCQKIESVLTEGTPHTIALTVKVDGQDHQTQISITLKDLIIVALGDSFGSGEGVPEINAHVEHDDDDPYQTEKDAIWQDKRCHRSLFSGFNQAILALTDRLKDRHVTFLDFTCSGATIKTRPGEPKKGGLLAPYEGKEHWINSKLIGPQVAEAGKYLCLEGKFIFNEQTYKGECKQSAIANNANLLTLISVGGNDVGFSKIIAAFALHKGHKKVKNMLKESLKRQEKLPGDFIDLDSAIKSSYPSKKTMIVEYPDPTHDENGNFVEAGPFCRAKALNKILSRNGVITSLEHQLAYEQVLAPLNNTIKNTASKLGWTYIGGMMNATYKRGICANPSNFSWIGAATARTDSFSGLYHPNIFGHLRYREAIYPELMRQVSKLGN